MVSALYKNNYCDNPILKEQMLIEPLNQSGLYQHEVNALEAVKNGSWYSNDQWLGKFQNVLYETCLVRSLFQRGYLQNGTLFDVASHSPVFSIKEYLRTKTNKLYASREKTIQQLKEYWDENDAKPYFSGSILILTEKAVEALELKSKPYEGQRGPINIYTPNIDRVYFEQNRYGFYERFLVVDSEEASFTTAAYLYHPFSLDIVRNGEYVFTLENILKIDTDFSIDSNCMVFTQQNEEVEEEIRYDLISGGTKINNDQDFIDYKEDFSQYNKDHYLKISQFKKIRGYISYYCSIEDELLFKILKEYYQDVLYRNDFQVEEIGNIDPDDISHNLLIRVPSEDVSLQQFVFSFYTNHLLFPPVIDGISILHLFYGLYIIHRGFTEKDFHSIRIGRYPGPLLFYFDETKDLIKKYGMQKIAAYVYQFPFIVENRGIVSDKDLSSQLSSQFNGQSIFSRLPYDVSQRVNNDHPLLGNMLDEVQSAGYFVPQWRNEYRLYLIVERVFPDAIFQYHPKWLSGQSLDIYIPSSGTAIEYQGEQHYRPVDFFGGKEEFEYRKKLDLEKKEKCDENNIRLLYWPYTKAVTHQTVKGFLRSLLG